MPNTIAAVAGSAALSAAAGSPNASNSSAPTTGNVASAATLLSTSGQAVRAFSDHASTAATAIVAAGAGPSSAIASAVAMNAGPIRTAPVGIDRNWPTSASPSSARNSSTGCQSEASVVATAVVTAAASRANWPATRIELRRLVPDPDGGSSIFSARNAPPSLVAARRALNE